MNLHVPIIQLQQLSSLVAVLFYVRHCYFLKTSQFILICSQG